ncbi:Swt1 family HEPN domain-containing protein [Paenibacillus sp. NPDC058174]|uniref:Swt1 family HEPN domain-containing protein n=1 Tax=Paenibacillus sp. NPDC058174 TaxID=3346366 RepID=UPI0036DF462D
MKLEFREEMLIPQINGDIYFSIYDLENWLRRICLTVYMVEYGGNWANHLPKKIKDSIKQKNDRNRELIYLDVDSEENIIWSLTQSELSQLLLNPTIWARVQELIGFSQERLAQKLIELREIRNLLAHNRALSERTYIITKGIIESLYSAIHRFKTNFIYNDSKTIMEDMDDDLSIYFSSKMEGNDWGGFQAFLESNEIIYSLVCLPVNRKCNYPSAYKLLSKFNEVIDNVIAIQVNKTGDEFIVMIPKKLPNEISYKIIDLFLDKDDLFTCKEFESQHPKYICNPKIWFYENRRPIIE